MDLLLKISRLGWWVYFMVFISFFSVALALNYFVKKINEARLDGRFIRIRSKTSYSRSIQVQRRMSFRLAPKVPLEIVLEQSNPSTVQGISLVFNKDENTDERRDRIDIKNFPDSRLLTTTSVNSDISPVDNVTAQSTDVQSSEITTPAFLGEIYKEINIVGRSKSLSNAEKDNDLDEVANKTNLIKQGIKSTPNLTKSLNSQSKEDLKIRSMTVAGSDLHSITSTFKRN